MGFNDLTTKEYIDILRYYKATVPTKSSDIKYNAEKIINSKLCGCVNKLVHVNAAKSIGICTKSIINIKGFVRGSFTCKNPKRNVTLKRKSGRKTLKKDLTKTTRKAL